MEACTHSGVVIEVHTGDGDLLSPFLIKPNLTGALWHPCYVNFIGGFV